MGNGPVDTADEHWTRLDTYLRTSSSDPGCDVCRLNLDSYAELTTDGSGAAELLPRVAAHLESCPDCREDLRGLVDAISHQTR